MITPPIQGEAEGQSDAARAWVARRDAAAQAVAAAEASREQAHVLELRNIEQQEGDASPIVFVIGFVVVFAALAIGTWFFIDRAQCNPLISDRAFSSQCRHAP